MKKNKGYTLLELVITTAITSTALVLGYQYYNYIVKQNSGIDKGNQLINFSKSTAIFVKSNQARLYMTKTTFPIKTISPELLKDFGFKDIPSQVKVESSILYPCAAIYVNNNKIQGFAYYRTDNKDISNGNISQPTIVASQSMGAFGGLVYTKNGKLEVSSAGKSWSLSQSDINTYFKQDGGDWLGGGKSACQGKYIVSPSVTYNLGYSFIDVNEEFNKENSLKQNANDLLANPSTGNVYADSVAGINLDTAGLNNGNSGDGLKQSKIIFQSNPNCVMNPSILSTMQDYDAGNDGGCPHSSYPFGESWLKSPLCAGIDKPNKWGCRNKQLAIGADSGNVTVGDNVSNVNLVKVNGFNTIAGSNSGAFGSEKNLNLSGLSADSIQATAEVGYAAKCDSAQVGALARQKYYDGSGGNKLNQLYSLNRSLMVCQKSLLCPQVNNSVGYCWMPLSNVTAKVNFSVADKIVAITAPTGFFIKEVGYYNVDTGVGINQLANNKQYNLGFGNRGHHNQSSYSEWVCNVHGDCNFGLWHEYTDTRGDIVRPGNGQNGEFLNRMFLASIDNRGTGVSATDVYAPYKDADFDIDNNTYGFAAKKELTQNRISFDMGRYFTNTGSSDRRAIISVSNGASNSYFANNAFKQYNTDSTGSYKKQVNVRYQVAQTRWDRNQGNGNCNRGDCDAWKFGRILSRPYYIQYIVLSNNTDEIAVGAASNSIIPVPVNPDPVTCNSSTIPSNITDEAGVAKNNYRGTCSNKDSDKNCLSPVIPYNMVANSDTLTSSNYNQYVCKVEGIASYCPDNSVYSLTYNMSNGVKIQCNNGSFATSCVYTNLHAGDVLANQVNNNGSIANHQNITLDYVTITAANGNVNDANGNAIGTYSISKTAGATACTSPTRLTFYETTY